MAACSSISVSRWNSRDARSRCSRRARAAARALSDSAVACAATVSNPPTTTPMKDQTAVLTALPLAYGQYRLGREHDSPRGPHVARALASPHPQSALRGSPGRHPDRGRARQLSELALEGRFRSVPGAHSFVWPAPSVGSEPIERLARNLP